MTPTGRCSVSIWCGWSMVWCSGHSVGFAAAYGAESHSFATGYSRKKNPCCSHTPSPLLRHSQPLLWSWPLGEVLLSSPDSFHSPIPRWRPSLFPCPFGIWRSVFLCLVSEHQDHWHLATPWLASPPVTLQNSCCLLFPASAVGLVPFIPASWGHSLSVIFLLQPQTQALLPAPSLLSSFISPEPHPESVLSPVISHTVFWGSLLCLSLSLQVPLLSTAPSLCITSSSRFWDGVLY